MGVQISGFDPEYVEAIKDAAFEEWTFDAWDDHDGVLRSCADGCLCAGETEEEFADRLAKAIWKANGAFCPVEVQATYLDQLPYEEHCRNEDDYVRLIGKPEPDTRLPYHLKIDGPLFRAQRELLLNLRDLAGQETPFIPAPVHESLLDGLIHLTDEMADQAHDRHGLDCLLETDDQPCQCEQDGYFRSGVPGILAHMEDGRLADGAQVQRCDLCQRYESDEAALQKLKELGHVDT